jgi:thiosulfate/3-mercaptopyruvate sulfurtransferase
MHTDDILTSATELAQRLTDERTVVLDVSKTFDRAEVIPKAIRFDLAKIFSDQNSPYPNTMLSEKRFQTECQKLGINSDSAIIVYDNSSTFNSPRVWYMFRSMGHKDVSILEGGMQAWKETGGKTVPYSDDKRMVGDFLALKNVGSFVGVEWIERNILSQEALLIDARSSGRFLGEEPEPRKNIPSGSISGSLNLPFTTVLNNGRFKHKQELKNIFSKHQVDNKPMVFTCGSGVTACILLAAAHIAGFRNTSVYDGSWTEWASLKIISN